MDKKSLLSAFLAVILIGGLILASAMRFGTVQASTDVSGIPKPSVPEFTVKLVAHPYDVPPTTTTKIDQYTGKETVITHPGYRVENKSIEITIKNQPFTPYTDADGHEIDLHYHVRVKGHFGNEWRELYSYNGRPAQSNSEYTVLSCSADYHVGAQVDFQVKASIGYYYKHYGQQEHPLSPAPNWWWEFARVEESDWSDTQTLTIGENVVIATPAPSVSPSPPETTSTPTSSPYDEPQQTEQEIIVGAVIVAAVIGAGLGLLIYLIKRK